MTLSPYLQEVAKRRTFAIISHPDAGKTTITEKVLLFGQAIQTAGTVKGRGSSQHAKSDWMEMEKQRGISITTSVMQFPYHDCLVNLLDTPGHEDFSEDTYRTLTAVDCCLMVIDAAKGVEDRTRKLMEVTRLRDTPILTFMNKLDRDIRDPMELLDEVENELKIGCAPTLSIQGVDLTAYADSLIERFSNPALKHRTWQIAMDGSQKLPQRMLDGIRVHLAQGSHWPLLALGVAGWMRYVSGIDDGGNAIDIRDPLADKIQKLVSASDEHQRVAALLTLEEIFGRDLPQDPQFVAYITAAWHQLAAFGARQAIAGTLNA